MARRRHGRYNRGYDDPDNPMYNSLRHAADRMNHTPEDDFDKIFVVHGEERLFIGDEEYVIENATHAIKDDEEFILLEDTWYPLTHETEDEYIEPEDFETPVYPRYTPEPEQTGPGLITYFFAGALIALFVFFIVIPFFAGTGEETSKTVVVSAPAATRNSVSMETSTIPVEYQTAVPTTTTPIEYLYREFHWTYGRHSPTFKIGIPKPLYEYYQQQPHDRNYAKYTITERDRKVLNSIITSFKENTDSKTEAAYNIVAFVQSLPYFKDNASTGYDEYPRYPIETLVDNGGDCEDTAILTAALLKEMDYDVVLLSPPGHMAVGITCPKCTGTYYTYNGKKYFYLETTSNNRKVGELPEKYKNQKVRVYPI